MMTDAVTDETVRVKEVRPTFTFDDGYPRQFYQVWIGRNLHSAVLSGGLLPKGEFRCSDHDDDCRCKQAVRAFQTLTGAAQ